MKNKKNIFLIIICCLIILVSFFFRVNWLEISPASVNFDEAALGYNTLSILETGKDEHGNFLPISLASFNDYKPALYAYLSLPFVKIMGLNQTSTRIVSAIAGTLTLILTSLIAYYFFRKSLILVTVTLLVAALQPWGLHFSRTAFESNLAVTFFTAGMLFLIINKGRIYEIISSIFFALSLYSYHSPRLAVPFILIFYILIRHQLLIPTNLKGFITNLNKKFFSCFIPFIFFVLLTLPLWFSLKDGLILTRLKQEGAFQKLSPFSPSELINKNNVLLTLPAHPIYYLSGQITGHFFAYFSPINLGSRVYHWVKNSPQNIPNFSMVGWGESIVFLIGLLILLSNLKEQNNKILLTWLMLATFPAVITWQWFHPLRALNIFPAINIVVVIGLIYLWKLIKPKHPIIITVIGLAYVVMQGSFLINNELVYGVVKTHGEYQPGGFKEGIKDLVSIQDKYDKVIIETPHAQGYIFFLYYQAFPPSEIQKYENDRKGPGNEGDLTFNFYKYEFRKIYWPEDRKLKNTVFWGTYLSLPEKEIMEEPGVKLRKEIKDVIGNTASVIVVKD